MRRIATAMVGALAVTVASCASVSSSPTGPSTAQVGDLAGETGSQVLAAALAAADTAGSDHYVLDTAEDSQKETATADYAPNEAHELLAVGTQQVEVLYVAGVAYVRGNAGGLESAMGLKPATATAYAERWIAVTPSNSLYSSLVKTTTLNSTLQSLKPTGKLTFTPPTTIEGRQALGVQGGLPPGTASGVTGSTVLYVAATKPTVPLEFKGDAVVSGSPVTSKALFTRWGQALHLSAPATSVPLSTVTASK